MREAACIELLPEVEVSNPEMDIVSLYWKFSIRLAPSIINEVESLFITLTTP